MFDGLFMLLTLSTIMAIAYVALLIGIVSLLTVHAGLSLLVPYHFLSTLLSHGSD